MEYLLTALITVISIVFLSIIGIITGFAIPGLFIVVLAPWLDWIIPTRKSDRPRQG